MATIKVYGHPFSPAARGFLGLPCRKGPRLREHNDRFFNRPAQEGAPNLNQRRCPDSKILDSRAITRYIAHAYADEGTPLILDDPKKMAIIGLWLEVESQKFDAAGQKLSYEILVKPMKRMAVDEGEQGQAELAAVLDVYETRLANSKYLGGEDFSLADLHHIPIIANLLNTKVKAVFEARPCVAAWAATLLARPSWKKATGA